MKFADDTKLFGVDRSLEEVDRIREDLLKICNWSSDWLMMFNVDKCKVMRRAKRDSNAC